LSQQLATVAELFIETALDVIQGGLEDLLGLSQVHGLSFKIVSLTLEFKVFRRQLGLDGVGIV